MNTKIDLAFSYVRNNYIQPFLWLTNLPAAFTVIHNTSKQKDTLCNSVLH